MIIRLWAGTAELGHAEGDRLTSIENLVGSVFDDILGGTSGDNTFEGGEGADFISGGEGVDTADYGSSASGVQIRLWAGTASGGDAAGDRLVGMENLVGSSFDDVLGGDGGANRLVGGEGADLLSGNAGDDILAGGAGADWLDGGEGVDTADYTDAAGDLFIRLYAGSGDGIWVGASPRYFPSAAHGDRFVSIENIIGGEFHDILSGDRHANAISGGGGNDFIRGYEGDDVLDGGAGRDRIQGGFGHDTVDYSLSPEGIRIVVNGLGSGGFAEGDRLEDIETLVGSSFDDVIDGNHGSNWLVGGDGADVLRGHDGADTLVGGDGADTLDGGTGDDTADYAASDGAMTIALASGAASGGHAEGDTLVGIENVVGSDFGDTISGSAAENRLFGGSGDDSLSGEGASDRLDGGDGDDRLFGGGGGDVLAGGAGVDTADYTDAEGGVFVRLWKGIGEWAASGDVLVEIEDVAGSAFDDALGGDAGDNRLFGRAGDDLVSGNGGDDRLSGGLGADKIVGGEGRDTADYSAAQDGVFVRLWAGVGLWGEAEGDTLVSVEDLLGSAFADVLAGDGADNRLEGGDGDDLLAGHGGNDTLVGGAGADVFMFGRNPGGDVILDFEASDQLDFRLAADLNTYDDFVAAAADEVDGLRIGFDGGDLFIQGVALSAIDPDQLIF